MKKYLILFCSLTLLMAGCRKEPLEPETPEQISLVGNWRPSSHTYFKVMFYYRDGTFCDSLVSDLGEDGFRFIDEKNVETPWGFTSTYTRTSSSISFDIMGVAQRDYQLLHLTQNNLVMERLDTAEYYTPHDETTYDTVVGYECEHWDLIRY